MSRTLHHSTKRLPFEPVKNKAIGYEYWSRRGNLNCMPPGPVSKWITKRRERALQRHMLFQAETEEGETVDTGHPDFDRRVMMEP